MEAKQVLPLAPGDLVVEAQGPEVRLWVTVADGAKIRLQQVGRSFTFMGKRFLQDVRTGKTLREAPELTVARVYSRKDHVAGAKLAIEAGKALGLQAAQAHLFYSGAGPSGTRWCFSANDHFTIPA